MADGILNSLLGQKLANALRQYVNDVQPGGLLNPEVPPGGPTALAKGLLGFTLGVGDAISGLDALDAARRGNYGEAGLNALGLLPFVPSLGGLIRDVRPPVWNQGRQSMPLAVWEDGRAMRSEVNELLRDPQAKSAYNTLRTLTDKKTGTVYAWPADAALHQDIGALQRLDPAYTVHGLIAP